VKLLVDACLAPSWVESLEKEGFDVVYWPSVGQATDPDTALLEWATIHDRIILTRDLDFSDLLAWHGLAKPSLVQLRTGDALPDEGVAELVVSVIRSAAEPLAHGAIVTIHVEKRRARIKRLFHD